jgi:2'-5' RNA ligase
MVRTGEKLNQFALVIYIPDPLARFLDDLRVELVAGCRPRAHVTVLPPRPLADVETASRQAGAMTAEAPPFELEAGDVEIFPKTNVIYIGLRWGTRELEAMHAAMNTGALAFDEPFEYHPHLTLAQDFDESKTAGLAALARQRWAAYTGPRDFRAETTAFVQNTEGNRWLDLAVFELGTVVKKA